MKAFKFAVLPILLLVSLGFNFYQYTPKNGKISTTAKATIINFEDSPTLIFSGYALWNESSKQPRGTKEYFQVKARFTKGSSVCSIITAHDYIDGISITSEKECELQQFLPEAKVAVVKYDSIVFKVSGENIVFADTSEPDHESGKLVGNWDIKY